MKDKFDKLIEVSTALKVWSLQLQSYSEDMSNAAQSIELMSDAIYDVPAADLESMFATYMLVLQKLKAACIADSFKVFEGECAAYALGACKQTEEGVPAL